MSASQRGTGLWHAVARRQLPLERETTAFVFASAIDLFVTYVLLTTYSETFVESNPIANYFWQRWNVAGFCVFKFGMVAFVAVIAQIIATKRYKTARGILLFATGIVAAVVAYSVLLFLRIHSVGL